AGLRIISLTHYDTSAYGHGTGTGTEGGLFPPADRLLADMSRLGIVLDATHASDATITQALDRYDGPVIATHQNCRALVPGERDHRARRRDRRVDGHRHAVPRRHRLGQGGGTAASVRQGGRHARRPGRPHRSHLSARW
ncbi:MAG: membrane dipeptidase, partial [Pseudomonadales bacterium]|nr:membrane dipeptidase [Pseudomonadales bacterium]